ncbi:RNA polymerase sigma factor [Gaoshiqia sediminis]|uniref:RNA polymerase sigma-70 factor n=1 Tax=Gaoshiqia sediminis TaxID=2986998 RepID=A0AA41Y703_9BACT|nr:RNA polymerase sigma-70 factor [Gaoshiqia sediminis]MCW0482068.1 RNA polymerase sigma-70 factor [Gaoshiqia sediminis]
MDRTDEQLFQQIRDDDYFSYNQLFMRYYARLCAFVYEYLQDEAVAEDLIQDLFLKLWAERKRIEIRERVISYLYKASRNAALNHLRSEKNRQKAINTLPLTESQPEDEFTDFDEFVVQLQACIDELPDRSKQVFVMSRIDGFKLAEISEKLGISVKTIKNQIWKSMQYLRSCLKQKNVL